MPDFTGGKSSGAGDIIPLPWPSDDIGSAGSSLLLSTVYWSDPEEKNDLTGRGNPYRVSLLKNVDGNRDHSWSVKRRGDPYDN